MIVIKQAKYKDIFELQKIIRLAFEKSIKQFKEAPPLYDDLQKLSNHIKDKHCFLAFENKSIIGGYISYSKNLQTYYLSRIFVSPLYSNKGVGTLLINDMFKRYSEVKIWQLHTVAADEITKKFYEKLGFIKIKEEIPGKVALSFYQKEM